jgi:hypothetical protein
MQHDRFKTKTIATMTVLALGVAWLFGLVIPSSASTAPSRAAIASSRGVSSPGSFVDIPVTGTWGSGGTFSGVLSVTNFIQTRNGLKAVGPVAGTFKDSGGATTDTLLPTSVKVPVTDASATCQILHLVLGPVNLNLLGLVVHLNRVVLDITAHQGPGNLLGNLLCALAHLLDGTIPNINDVLANLLTAVVKTVGTLNLIG